MHEATRKDRRDFIRLLGNGGVAAALGPVSLEGHATSSQTVAAQLVVGQGEDTPLPLTLASDVGWSRDISKTPSPELGSDVALTRPQNPEALAFLPVTHLAHLLLTRQITSLELTELYLSRVERFDPVLKCVVTLTRERALAQARRADHEIDRGRYRGPLHGVPWGSKDIIAVRGYPTTWGLEAFKHRVIDNDATVVQLLDHAGAVHVAKLSTGELARGDRWFGGRTNNPWQPSEGSSGSSAGPAAAVAAGLVAFALGTETGGSLLSPASVCGATALRPSFGRVSGFGVMSSAWSLDRIGPLCRCVDDCALVFQVISQPDSLDPRVAPRPFTWNEPIEVGKLRVGYLQSAFADQDRDSKWRQNEAEALEHLRGVGISLTPLQLPELPLEATQAIMVCEQAAAFDELLRADIDKTMLDARRGVELRRARSVSAVQYMHAQRARAVVMQLLAKATAPFDVYIAPYFDVRRLASSSATSALRAHFSAANLCGYPCISAPNGFSERGTPTNITFVARPHRESAVVALAREYQRSTKWHLEHPKL